jgi:hypothetical protein
VAIKRKKMSTTGTVVHATVICREFIESLELVDCVWLSPMIEDLLHDANTNKLHSTSNGTYLTKGDLDEG